MNMTKIVLNEFKLSIRNSKSNIMMILFPIVLIIILGSAFTKVFDSTVKLGDVKVLYSEDVKESNFYLTNAFKSFREGLTEETGITFEKTDDIDKGMASVSDCNYSAYLHISDETQEIKLYKNERYNLNSSILETALNGFINTYGAMSVIALNKPDSIVMEQGQDQIQSKIENSGDFVTVRPLDAKRKPGSLDYYAITMLTMILLYASMTGFWSVRSDIEQMTANRTLCAPVKKFEFLTGKVLGCILVTLVQALIVLLFSRLMLNANWGNDMLTVVVLMLSQSIMAISMGVGLAYLFKNGEAAVGVLNTIIPLFVFLGGGYVPVDVMGSAFYGIAKISPVNWINTALFNVIYDGNYSKVAISLGINITIATVFILIAALFSRRGIGRYA